jgi:protein-L-isoaspartate(D-aspartate) O-methyltransferase
MIRLNLFAFDLADANGLSDIDGEPKMPSRILIQLGLCVAVASTLVAATHSLAQDSAPGAIPATDGNPKDDPTAAARNRMVQRHLVERGLKNQRVLEAFRTVPRHRFLPPETQRQAYDDESIPIGEGQTITPPFDVAFMTEVLDPKPTDRVYEVGTGSGYQSAILSQLVKDVYSVEIHAPLSKRATEVHKKLGYANIHTRVGDGYVGWPEAAPFDAIIVTCAPTKVPQPLFDQLKEGGRMVIPIGDRFHQIVHLIIKKDGKRVDRELKPTLFVPMTGRDQEEAAAARRDAERSKKASSKEGPEEK